MVLRAVIKVISFPGDCRLVLFLETSPVRYTKWTIRAFVKVVQLAGGLRLRTKLDAPISDSIK